MKIQKHSSAFLPITLHVKRGAAEESRTVDSEQVWTVTVRRGDFLWGSFNCPGLTVRTVNDGLWTVQNLPRQFRHQSTPLTCIAAVYGIA
ncbi:hypothetical protein LSTR_LSTR007548 [Laodelphax striatellus]|uniref:Uncharacterized protein n=1 Tax=Laodelphax striatellus TaxID=195883 RepID=A0A482XU56_LAOST|nr:hypothetical protein LSTR_LSTR007548 [Laodelphax striatellus]